MTAATRDRLAIWTKTLLVAFVYVGAVWAAHRFVTSRWIVSPWLSAALAFCAIQLLFAGMILLIVYAERRIAETRRQQGLPALPRLRGCLALHASGEDQTASLAPLSARFPAEFETALSEFLHGLRGAERNRLRALAVAMGLEQTWIATCRSGNRLRRRAAVDLLACMATPEAVHALERALKDPEESLRLNAARALIARRNAGESDGEGDEEIGKIFHFSLFQAPVVRALVAEDLRPFLLPLASKALPDALRSGDGQQVLGALDMIWAWGRAIDLPEAAAFIDSEDSLIRAVAIHACRYAAPHALRGRIAARLGDPAAVVRRAAAEAAGRMHLDENIAPLMRCLDDPDERVTRAAARALASMGEKGLRLLEAEVIEGSAAVAAVALEAVEKARIGRMDWE